VPGSDLAVAVNYYAPYVSGLTEAARLVAEGLAADGWRVTVVTSQHDPALPRREVVNGVDVIRCPVVAKVSKGTVSPTFPFVAAREARRASVANLHLPMVEAGAIAALAGRTPLVLTYQCDVALPPGLFNRAAVRVVDGSSRRAIARSASVVVSSHDYAASSRVADAMRGKLSAIVPPCLERPAGTPRFRAGDGLHIGFLGRIVQEKGLEYLIEAFFQLDDPDARLLLGGDFEGVAGGSVIDDVRRRGRGHENITFLGFLPAEQLTDFYASLDVFVLPSVNPLEAFGIAQVEAMLAGVPVIATDMPGVRIPVQRTEMGMVVAPRDAHALADALRHVRAGGVDREAGAERARSHYGVDRTVEAYADLFRQLGARPR
jgi:glycosyltransferase involved in cell wall biosynthesis